jgi:hypothetical protein
MVADTNHVAPGGSIDRKYLLGLISDLAGNREPAICDSHNLVPVPPFLASRPTTPNVSGTNAMAKAFQSDTYFRVLGRGLRTSSPTFSPFSERNSMPASSNASRILFTASSETCRRSFSKSTTVDRPNAALSASCDWVMSNNARAARHCAGVRAPTILVDHGSGGTYKHFLLIT